MTRDEITQVIEETILEMLQEGDERLIGLMMEHEKNLGSEPGDTESFVNEAIDELSKRLGLITEEEEAEVDQVVLEEQRKMLKLIEWLED